MAKKGLIKDRATKDIMYPITTTDCVITNNGRSIKEEYATKQYADEAAADILNSSPEQLQVINTLGEKLADDSDLANIITQTIATKADAAVVNAALQQRPTKEEVTNEIKETITSEITDDTDKVPSCKAVKTQVNLLSTGFLDDLSEVEVNSYENGYFRSTGEYNNSGVSSNAAKTYRVKPGQMFFITCTALGSAAGTVNFYNDETVLDRSTYLGADYCISGDNKLKGLIIVVPNGAAMMAVSYLKTKPYLVRCSSNGITDSKHFEKLLADTATRLESLDLIGLNRNPVDIAPEQYKHCYIRYSNGTIATAGDTSRTMNVYEVKPGQIYFISCRALASLAGTVTFFNSIDFKAETYLGSKYSIAGDARDNKITVIVPSGATHMAISRLTAQPYDIKGSDTGLDPSCFTNESQIKKHISDNVSNILNPDYVSENPLEIVKETPGYTSIFRKMGVIGGSMSSGVHSYNTGTSAQTNPYEYSTLQFMARLCGAEGFNFSQGGMSAKIWCDHKSVGGESELFKNNPCQMYLIQLGNNDVALIQEPSNNYTLGTIEDLKPTEGEYNTNTYYGCMAKIIDCIRKIQPRAYVFLSTFLNGYGTLTPEIDYNEAIRNIAEYYRSNAEDGLHYYLIDYYKYGKPYRDYNSGIHKDTVRGSHLVATGYLYWAYEYCTYIDWIIKNNMADFNDVAFVGTDRYYK